MAAADFLTNAWVDWSDFLVAHWGNWRKVPFEDNLCHSSKMAVGNWRKVPFEDNLCHSSKMAVTFNRYENDHFGTGVWCP
jgi:hypothetical protein